MVDVETRQELNQGPGALNCAFRFRGMENEKSFLAYVEGSTTTALVRFTLENRELKITKKEAGSDELEKGWLKVKPVIDADGNRILIVGPASEDSTEEQMPLNYWQLRRKALGWLLF